MEGGEKVGMGGRYFAHYPISRAGMDKKGHDRVRRVTGVGGGSKRSKGEGRRGGGDEHRF